MGGGKRTLIAYQRTLEREFSLFLENEIKYRPINPNDLYGVKLDIEAYMDTIAHNLVEDGAFSSYMLGVRVDTNDLASTIILSVKIDVKETSWSEINHITLTAKMII